MITTIDISIIRKIGYVILPLSIGSTILCMAILSTKSDAWKDFSRMILNVNMIIGFSIFAGMNMALRALYKQAMKTEVVYKMKLITQVAQKLIMLSEFYSYDNIVLRKKKFVIHAVIYNTLYIGNFPNSIQPKPVNLCQVCEKLKTNIYQFTEGEFSSHNESKINCTAISPKSGQLIAVGCNNCKINLWNLNGNENESILSGHTNSIEKIRFSHDDKYIIAGSRSGSLKVWDVQREKIIRSLAGHKARVNSLEFHIHGNLIVSAGNDSVIKIWDMRKMSFNKVKKLIFSQSENQVYGIRKDYVRVYTESNNNITSKSVFLDWGNVCDIESYDNKLISCSVDDYFLSLYDLPIKNLENLENEDIAFTKKVKGLKKSQNYIDLNVKGRVAVRSQFKLSEYPNINVIDNFNLEDKKMDNCHVEKKIKKETSNLKIEKKSEIPISMSTKFKTKNCKKEFDQKMETYFIQPFGKKNPNYTYILDNDILDKETEKKQNIIESTPHLNLKKSDSFVAPEPKKLYNIIEEPVKLFTKPGRLDTKLDTSTFVFRSSSSKVSINLTQENSSSVGELDKIILRQNFKEKEMLKSKTEKKEAIICNIENTSKSIQNPTTVEMVTKIPWDNLTSNFNLIEQGTVKIASDADIMIKIIKEGNFCKCIEKLKLINNDKLTIDYLAIFIKSRNIWILENALYILELILPIYNSTIEKHLLETFLFTIELIKKFENVIKITISTTPTITVDLSRDERIERCNKILTYLKQIKCKNYKFCKTSTIHNTFENLGIVIDSLT
ncbi:hypothetical protein A3Q56_02237 [Intoshia linei]|uniref:Katanin p80 subunit C-terminal domain-containing protein n=1 Tax=Intoshia linei TaxID=1819745 RepID=A0A177B6R5_9BILA|nr:hypothetical protein A3Q56_02237 [Intoshia linei]